MKRAVVLSALAGSMLCAADLEQGRKIYAAQCLACHGAEGSGTERGPALAGNRRLRARTEAELRGAIREGVPAKGMPAFPLAAEELEAITAFTSSLNASAGASGAGDRAAGEQFFFGRGKCAGCHTVASRGRAVGPDLTSVGRDMKAEEIAESIEQPGARIAAGYGLVTVRMRDGSTLRGFARNRSNFDLQLQDLEGRFHLLDHGEYASIVEEKESLMPAVKMSAPEKRDLMAYLTGLAGVEVGAPAAAVAARPDTIGFERIAHPRRGEWPTYNGNLSANRYSELTNINSGNVGKLTMQWMFSIPHFGLETTPVVVDGIMYVTGPNQAFALDARTGRQLWQYWRPRTEGLTGDGAKGTNRGVAVLGDKVFLVTDNAHMLALDRMTGALAWDVYMPDSAQHYGATSAPLVVKNMVISGVAGADEGIRGFIAAYKAATGERVWRHWTIPARGEPGYDSWKGPDPEFGGASTWLTGSYDEETDTLFWPTGNPWPDFFDKFRAGDNLYSNCILALDPATGALKWHRQFTPHDLHDWDATEPPVLVDAEYRGRPRKLLLHADRNGFFYVLDRTNGEFLLGKRFVEKLTWASGIDAEGRPQVLPANVPPPEGEVGCPSIPGATNWMATAFSPQTRLYYVMALEECQMYAAPGGQRGKKPHLPSGKKYLRALDIETGKIVWEVPQIGPSDTWSGVLATAGGIVFYGSASGAFAAVDARDGRDLWHFHTSQQWKASPMTFLLDGKQYVAITSGPNILCFGL